LPSTPAPTASSTRWKNYRTQGKAMAMLRDPVTPADHIRGPATAPATLVEYGDYECPYCGAAYPIVKEIQSQLGDRLRFVFRNFPITTSHPHAEQAAETAESAAAQGQFWQMHDLLYENQKRLRDPDLRGYAETLGLDVERFDKDLAEHVHAVRVREDFMSGVRSGVNGTPTFYINGARHDDSYDLATMLAALERAAGAEAS
jgi:protein-disulfide isomerase